MQKTLVSFVLAGFLSACVHTENPPALVTPDMALPSYAKDSRDDGVWRDSSDRPVRYPLLGQTLPGFELPMARDEGTFTTESLRGQWTVMAVWGLWCHDSRNDADNINALGEALSQTADIDFVSLHVPYSAQELDILYRQYGSVENFFALEEISWPVALDETSVVRDELQIQWTPSYLVIGPDLTVEGFRTDFSVGGDDEMEAFLSDLQALKAARE